MKFVLIYILMIPFFLHSSPAEQVADENVIHNGNAWFRFGPALIDCAKSARCSWWEGADDRGMVVVTDKEDLSQLKAFVRENFYGKLDYAPVAPEQGSYFYATAIALYDSAQPPAPDKSGDGNSLIVHIPFGQTMGNRHIEIKKEYLDLVKRIDSRTKEQSGKNRKGTGSIAGFSPPYSGLDGKNNGQRWNGIAWFWFGQALVDCAQSARCSWQDGENIKEVMVTGKEGLSLIKAFAKENFQWRLGNSPIVPEHQNVVYANAISLYNVSPPLFKDGQSPSADNLIIHIPLSPQTTVGRDEIIMGYQDLMRKIDAPSHTRRMFFPLHR
ncbi:MAG: hypothetical protein FWG50_04335 [Kiritimatiellaeota bacterium]|nr:hypothetical protein [Kiritimatiellota bacterium]